MKRILVDKKIIILTLIIFGILFYWYAVRPSSIKKECHEISIRGAIDQRNREKGVSESQYDRGDYQYYYDMCLKSRGL